MKIRLTFELDDHDRLAIGNLYGTGKANRETCAAWIKSTVKADLEVVGSDYDAERQEEVDREAAQQGEEG